MQRSAHDHAEEGHNQNQTTKGVELRISVDELQQFSQGIKEGLCLLIECLIDRLPFDLTH